MKFEEKYISNKEATVNPNPKKIEISNEAYAIGEMLEKLITKLHELKFIYRG